MGWFDKKEGKRFGRDIRDMYGAERYWRWKGSTFIKIDSSGQVVETGNPIWGEEGRVYWVGLPFTMSEYGMSHDFEVPLCYSVGDFSETCITVSLTYSLLSGEFDYQEIYDRIVKGNNKGLHLEDWLKERFLEAALASKEVKKAFENYMKHERSLLFVEELGEALKGIGLSGRPLSLIEWIKVTAQVDIIAKTLPATFNGSD